MVEIKKVKHAREGDKMPPTGIPQSFVISTVQEQWDDGTWTIKSNDLRGLFLAGRDLAELEADVPDAIRILFLLNHETQVDVEIMVRPAIRSLPLHPKRYAAIPKAA